MIVWRLGGKITRTVLCCIVYNSCAQWYVHMWTVLKSARRFRFRFRVVLSISCFVVLALIILFLCCLLFSFSSTKPRGWLARSPKWPILRRVGDKTLTQSTNQQAGYVFCHPAKCSVNIKASAEDSSCSLCVLTSVCQFSARWPDSLLSFLLCFISCPHFPKQVVLKRLVVFKHLQAPTPDSRTFQAWKTRFYNSTTFRDLYQPWLFF